MQHSSSKRHAERVMATAKRQPLTLRMQVRYFTEYRASVRVATVCTPAQEHTSHAEVSPRGKCAGSSHMWKPISYRKDSRSRARSAPVP